jgi:hypothetical protein
MNKILILSEGPIGPTDQIASYAARLAKRINASVQTALTTTVITSSPYDDGGEKTCFQQLKDRSIKYILVQGDIYYGACTLMIDPKFREVLQETDAPIIIVPPDMPVRYSEKYIFLTDITAEDTYVTAQLCELAAISAASIMLTQVNAPRPLDQAQLNSWNTIMRDKISQTDYGRIYYHYIPDNIDKTDMEYLLKDSRAEALALVYPQPGLLPYHILSFGFRNVIYGSLKVPLIIFPSFTAFDKN